MFHSEEADCSERHTWCNFLCRAPCCQCVVLALFPLHLIISSYHNLKKSDAPYLHVSMCLCFIFEVCGLIRKAGAEFKSFCKIRHSDKIALTYFQSGKRMCPLFFQNGTFLSTNRSASMGNIKKRQIKSAFLIRVKLAVSYYHSLPIIWQVKWLIRNVSSSMSLSFIAQSIYTSSEAESDVTTKQIVFLHGSIEYWV